MQLWPFKKDTAGSGWFIQFQDTSNYRANPYHSVDLWTSRCMIWQNRSNNSVQSANEDSKSVLKDCIFDGKSPSESRGFVTNSQRDEAFMWFLQLPRNIFDFSLFARKRIYTNLHTLRVGKLSDTTTTTNRIGPASFESWVGHWWPSTRRASCCKMRAPRSHQRGAVAWGQLRCQQQSLHRQP